MRIARPSEWSLRRRRAEAHESDEIDEIDAPPPMEDDDDLLRQISDTALRLLIIGAVVAVLLWTFSYIRVVVIPVILAVFITALLAPPVQWLRARGLSRGLSTTIAFVGAILLFGGVMGLIIQRVVVGFGDLAESVGEAVTQLQTLAASLGLDAQLIDELVQRGRQELQSDSSQLVSGAWTGAVVLGEVLLGFLLMLVLSVYFLHSGDRLMEWTRSLFPGHTQRAFRVAGELSYDVIGRYVRGVALVGLIDAVGIGLVLLIVLDVNLALPLIMLTFIGAFLPVVGAFVTGVLAAVVAYVTEGLVIALVVVIATLVVQQLESNVFAPKVYGRSLALPSAVVLLAITVGGIVAGILGMFLATPVTAVLAALLRRRPFATAEEARNRTASVSEVDRSADRAAAAAADTADTGATAAPAGSAHAAQPPSAAPGDSGSGARKRKGNRRRK